MRTFVVDASVAIKWFLDEIHSEAALRLLDPTIERWAPDLIGPEVANVLWKKVRRNELSRDEAAEILAAFQAIGVQTVPSGTLLTAALRIAVELDRTVYDSLYVALAVARSCQLISADQKLISAVAASSLAEHIQFLEEEWS